MKKLSTLEFTRLATLVLRMPTKCRQDLSRLLLESLSDGQPTKKPAKKREEVPQS